MPWIVVTGSTQARQFQSEFQEGLRGLAGTWSIDVAEDLVGGWWLAVFRRDDGFERTLLLSPMEQAPGPLRQSVAEAFQSVPLRKGSASPTLPPGVTQDRRATPRR
jgi:hypothetical protein